MVTDMLQTCAPPIVTAIVCCSSFGDMLREGFDKSIGPVIYYDRDNPGSQRELNS